MNEKHLQDNYFFFRLIKRFTIFLLLLLIVFFLFYLCGNFQQFLDSTQRVTLLLCSVVAIMLLIFSVVGFIDSIIMTISTHKAKFLLYFFSYLLLIVLTSVMFITMRVISFICGGLN